MTKQSQKRKITYSRDLLRKMCKKGVYHLTKLATYKHIIHLRVKDGVSSAIDHTATDHSHRCKKSNL